MLFFKNTDTGSGWEGLTGVKVVSIIRIVNILSKNE